MRTFFFGTLFTCIFFTVQLYAQQTITGIVYDKSNEPLYGAIVGINGTTKATRTDEKGNFSINVPTEKTTLRISLIGYEQVFIKTDKNSTYFKIKLISQSKTLGTVDINPYAIDIVAKNANWDVIDYLWINQRLVLLTYWDAIIGYRLLLLGEKRTVIDSLDMPETALGLYKDCNASQYVVGVASSYKLTVSTEKLALSPAIHLQQFEAITLPCAAADSAYNYYEERNENNPFIQIGTPKYAIRYYAISKTNPKKEQQNITIISGLYTAKIGKPEKRFLRERKQSGAYSFSELQEGDELLTEKMLYKDLYNPLFKIRDSIWIFNHTAGSITSYTSNGTVLKTTPINYQLLKTWKRALVINEEQKNVYALFNNNAAAELKEVNLATGAVVYRQKIPALFPEKVKVKESYIYFVGKQKGAKERLFLARMALN